MNTVLVEDDNLMVFQPKLAKLLGINETIILNQIHYWLEKKKNIIDGVPWVYNTYEDWQKQICYLSVSTIKKVIRNLESIGIVKSSNFNKSKIDKTKWYTIEYEVLQNLYKKTDETKDNNVIGDISDPSRAINTLTTDINEPSIDSNIAEERVELNQAIPKTNSETTTKVKEEKEDGRKNPKTIKENDSPKTLKVFEDNDQYAGEFKKVVDFFSQNIRLPSPYELEKIRYICDEFKESELIIIAIKESIESNARNLRYVEKVLYNWLDKGIKTSEAAEKSIEDYKRYKGGKTSEGFKGNHWENRFNNSKDSSNSKGKWTGYKPPEPKGRRSIDDDGLI